VLIGTSEGAVSLRDVRDLRGGLSINCFKNTPVTAACKLDCSSDWFVVASRNRLCLWDRRFVSSAVLHFSPGESVHWVDNFEDLIACGTDRSVQLHCPRSGSLLASLPLSHGSASALAPRLRGLVSSECPVLAGDVRGRVAVFDVRGRRGVWREDPIRGHLGAVTALKGLGSSTFVSVGVDGLMCVREFVPIR